MRIFISTGEVSGDLQGGMLVEALYRQAQIAGLDLEIIALGGAKMEAAGAKLIADTTTISSLGLFEAVPFILPTWQIQQRAKEYLQANPPELVVLMDYVGPNLAIGSYIHEKLPNLPIIWYIGPQYWVWTPLKQNVEKLVEITDQLLAIFPQEAKFFRDKELSVTYVGHPLLDRIKTAPSREEARETLGLKPEQTAIALLPASRQQEIKYLLPVICEAARQIQVKLPEVHFYLPISLPNYRRAIEEMVKSYNLQATLLAGQTLEAIAAADLAITKSGTVNLEVALLNVPQVIIYKVNPITIWIARHILNFSISFMSPPNLVLREEIVPELLQEKATAENIVNESLELLLNQQRRQQVQLKYQQMRQALGEGEEGISDRTAQEILKFVLKKSSTLTKHK
jgi:lipid-A-disaccharide synthase